MSSTIEKALQRAREAKAAAEKARAEKVPPHPPQKDINAASEAPMVTTEPMPRSETLVDVPSQTPHTEVNANESADVEFTIDLERLEQNGHVSITGQRKQINEEYREIKRKLLLNAFGPLSTTLKNPNIIMVTSARPSEGKTFTAVNLALSIAAEQDKTVLLVDTDVLRPNVLNTLGLDKRKGIMDYLTGSVADISDVLYSTNVNKLKIIPAGRSHNLSTELLASQKMHDVVNEFANRYPDRVVIFDTPPLIGITESAVLANFAGQAVVVVEENKSKLSDIRHAVERLNADMAIGFVVNKSVNNDSEGTGYYGYYYAER